MMNQYLQVLQKQKQHNKHQYFPRISLLQPRNVKYSGLIPHLFFLMSYKSEKKLTTKWDLLVLEFLKLTL